MSTIKGSSKNLGSSSAGSSSAGSSVAGSSAAGSSSTGSVTNLQCSVCGGLVQFGKTRRISSCLYCGSPLLLSDAKHCPRYLIPSLFSPEEIKSKAQTFLRERRVDGDFSRNAELDFLRLLYIPLYRVRGTSFVAVEKRREGSQDTELYFRDTAYEEFATSEKDYGLLNFELSSQEQRAILAQARPFERDSVEEGTRIFTPDESPEQFESIFIQRGEKKQLMRGLRSELFSSKVSLYYYPIYLLRFSYQSIPYRFILDGARGRIIEARLPESKFFASLLAQLILLFSAFFSWSFLAFLKDTAFYRQLTGLAIIVTICLSALPLAILYGLWLRLSHGRELKIVNDEVFLMPLHGRKPDLLEGLADALELYLPILFAVPGQVLYRVGSDKVQEWRDNFRWK